MCILTFFGQVLKVIAISDSGSKSRSHVHARQSDAVNILCNFVTTLIQLQNRWIKLRSESKLIFFLRIYFEVAIPTAPVCQRSFAIRTVFVLHMRNKAMFNLFVRRMFLKFIRTAAKGAAQYRHIVDIIIAD